MPRSQVAVAQLLAWTKAKKHGTHFWLVNKNGSSSGKDPESKIYIYEKNKFWKSLAYSKEHVTWVFHLFTAFVLWHKDRNLKPEAITPKNHRIKASCGKGSTLEEVDVSFWKYGYT